MKSWRDVRKGSAPNTLEAAFDLFAAHVGTISGLSVCDMPAGAREQTERHAWLKERMRKWLTRHWPAEMQGSPPFHGDVIVYLLRERM